MANNELIDTNVSSNIEPYMFSKIYHHGPNCRKNLIQLLGKFTNSLSKNHIKKIYHMIKTNISDHIIIDYINKNKPIQKTKAMESKSRAIRIANIWYSFLTNTLKNKNLVMNVNEYLDIGCNNGIITVEFGKKFGLDNNCQNQNQNRCQIHGIDVDFFTQQQINPVAGFDFKTYDGYHIPYDDNFFDLITCSMVLHHIPHINIILKEINRVTRLGGILLIKEHNSFSIYVEWLIYLEHLLYDVMDYGVSYDEFYKTYYQSTFTTKTLTDLLKIFGFDLLEISNNDFIKANHYSNPTKFFYALYVKNRNS